MNMRHAATCVALAAWLWIFVVASGLGNVGATPPGSTISLEARSNQPGAQRVEATTLRIDTGSSTDYIDVDGNLWVADTGFVGGRARGRYTVPISGTPDDRIYQTERYAMSAYLLPVSNGRYSVRLHFAEDNRLLGEPGKRVFGVQVEDTTLPNVDVYAEAGALYKALVRSVDVEVDDGQLDILFTSIADNPQIKGIEVLPLGGGAEPTATPTRTSTPTASATPTATRTPTPTITPTPKGPGPAPSTRLHLPMIFKSPPVLALPACGDQEDADDTPAGAAALRLGVRCRGSLAGDGVSGDDWLYVNATAGKTLAVDLTDMPTGADYDLFVFDAELKDGAANPVVGGNGPEHVEIALRATGKYYIRVVVYTRAAGANTYSLRAVVR